MKEHPIPFSAPMVRAILAGTKTMTRRVIVPQPRVDIEGVLRQGENLRPDHIGKCPYGIPGDRLWVREAHKVITAMRNAVSPDLRELEIVYLADNSHAWVTVPYTTPHKFTFERYRPPMFMWRWASRILLENTGVKVERVQDITPGDCEEEGIFGKTLASPGCGLPYEEYTNGDGIIYPQPISAFAALWDSINAKRGYGWDTNPLVRAVSFKILEVKQ